MSFVGAGEGRGRAGVRSDCMIEYGLIHDIIPLKTLIYKC